MAVSLVCLPCIMYISLSGHFVDEQGHHYDRCVARRFARAVQKGNAACLLQAGRVRGSADLLGDTGWEEDIEDLLQEAAAGAGLGVAA